MINRDNVLPVDQNTSTERIFIIVILGLTSPPTYPYPRRTEDRDHLGPLPHRHSVRRRFVRPQNVRQPIRADELLHGLLPVAHRAGPAFPHPEPVLVQKRLLPVLRGVRPEQVRHELLQLGVVLRTGRRRQLERRGNQVDGVDRGRLLALQGTRDPAVHAEDHVVDRGGHREVVEHLVGASPDLQGDVLGEARAELAEEAARSVVFIEALGWREGRKDTFTAFTS